MSTLFQATPGGSLTERYVHAVTRRLPEDQRGDVAEELRGSVADRIDAMTHERPDLDGRTAEREAIEELGDPDRLAAGYTGRRLQLIGPELYPSYARVLRAILVVAVPAAAIVVGIVTGFTEGALGPGIASAVSTGITVLVQVAFWVTLAYAVIERGVGGAEARSTMGVDWTPDQLPELPDRRGSLADAVGTVVWLGLIGVAIVWQQVRSPLTAGDDRAPLLDPDLWSFWLPLILLLLVAEMAFEVVKYRTARVRPGLQVVIGAVFALPLVYLGATDQLLNPAAVADIQQHWTDFNPDVAHATVAVTALAIWLWDSVEGWLRADRTPAARPGSRSRS